MTDDLIALTIRWDAEDDEAARGAARNAETALQRALEDSGIQAGRIPEAKQLVAQLKEQYDGTVSDEGCVRALRSRLPSWFEAGNPPGTPKRYAEMTADEQRQMRARYNLK